MRGLFRRLFGPAVPPAPPPPEDRREWNEDWCAGDLAECVGFVKWNLPPDFTGCPPGLGAISRVRRVQDATNWDGTVRMMGLVLEGYGPCGWECVHFRKLRPKLEPASDEFTAELRDRLLTGKPAREPVEAGRAA